MLPRGPQPTTLHLAQGLCWNSIIDHFIPSPRIVMVNPPCCRSDATSFTSVQNRLPHIPSIPGIFLGFWSEEQVWYHKDHSSAHARSRHIVKITKNNGLTPRRTAGVTPEIELQDLADPKSRQNLTLFSDWKQVSIFFKPSALSGLAQTYSVSV